MKFVDLSHPIYNDMPTYPSDPDVSIIREKEISTNRTLLHSFTMGTHTGTHLDAPAHVIQDGKTLDEFPLSSFSGHAVKVDENSYNRLKQIDGIFNGVIYETGWYKHFYNSNIFYGRKRPIIPQKLIEVIIGLGIKYFGCDLPSVDTSGSDKKLIHH